MRLLRIAGILHCVHCAHAASFEKSHRSSQLKIRLPPLEATLTGGNSVLIEKEAERERLLPQTRPVVEAMAGWRRKGLHWGNGAPGNKGHTDILNGRRTCTVQDGVHV